MELSNKDKDVPEPDFVWEDYLEETKSYAASPNSFVHVEYSLESGFKMGMKMEVPNKEEEDHYWMASVIMTCGPLLSVRYTGYGDDRSADFWVDVKSGDVHPVGWCNKNNKALSPPKGVRERHKDIKLLLNKELLGAATVPASLLEDPSAGMTPIDQIKVQMKVEVIDDHNPKNVWIATVMQNVGGRLLLRYDGTTGTTDDFWQFYLSSRIRQVGWAKNRAAHFSYSPPESKKFQHTEENWNEILSSSFEEAKSLPFPEEVLEPQIAIEEHSFEEGMKLEALNPETLLEICPATVIKIINKFYFMVSIDSYTNKEKENKPLVFCHSNSHEIFPINWASENGVELTYPEGYKEEQQSEKFDWDAYLSFCNAKAAPSDLFLMIFMNMGFDAEKKLEAVNPFAPDQICAATVKKVADPLMWIRLESVGLHSSEIISTVDSFDIFPVGWCGSNGYPLQAPLLPKPAHKYLKAPQQPKDSSAQQKKSDENDSSPPKEQSKAWCPRIYFNHRCFSGPLLSKGRLAELPRQVGPGPIALVMKEVLTLLVSVAYKSSRVLSELQLHGKPDPKMQHSVIKAKYKGKSYRATVEFIRSSDQLEEFCRMICKKLDCCPYLFGPSQIVDECPDKCHNLTKTKFGHNFVKKHKKPGRPPLSSYGALASKKGRRKKRIHWRFLRNLSSVGEKKQESNDSEEKPESEEASLKRTSEPDDSDGVGNERKRHKPAAIPPPRSEIVTRGAKLPNFGLEMKWRHNVSPFLPRKVGRPPGRPSLTFSGRKVGRPIGSKKKIIMPSVVKQLRNSSQPQQKEVEHKVAVKEEELPNGLNLESDPVKWSVDDVVRFVKETECAPVAWVLKEQEIDGQALLMLTLPSVQEFLHLKTGPARLLCSLVEKVKLEYLTRFAQNHS